MSAVYGIFKIYIQYIYVIIGPIHKKYNLEYKYIYHIHITGKIELYII